MNMFPIDFGWGIINTVEFLLYFVEALLKLLVFKGHTAD